MKAIGLDIGTTSICGILIDAQDGHTIKTITLPNDTFLPTQNPWERIQAPERIYAKVVGMLEELVCDDVCAIGVTGQMHGILYLDQAGNAVSPLYTWQDMRGDLPYKDTTYAKYLNSATGYGHVTHFYHVANQLVPQNMHCFCTIGDFIAMKIGNAKSPLMHSSNAASLGLFDLLSNKFTCDFEGEITNDFNLVGRYGRIPVSVAIGDNQAAFLGSGGNADSVLVNVGTGSQISVVATQLENSDMEIRPYLPGRFLLVGAALCGGRAYAVLKDFFDDVLLMLTGTKHTDTYACMEKQLQGDCFSDLIFNNQFSGSRQDPTIRGSIQNIGIANFTARDFIIGSLNGIVHELYDMYQKNGLTAKRLIASGNGIRKNKALQKIFAKKFGLALYIPVYKEEAAYGAALFSLLSSKHFRSIEQAEALIRYEP